MKKLLPNPAFYRIVCGLFCIVLVFALDSCVKRYEAKPTAPDPVDPVVPPDGTPDALPDLSVPATFDWNDVYISFPIPSGVRAEDISVEIPVLKYGKKFAYSYTFDDDVVQAYGKAFCTINKKWVDAERFYHVGQVKTTGVVPSKTLGYTDGCGNERRFTFGVATWPNYSTVYIDNFMAPTSKDADKYYPYLVWRDVVPLLDFGNSLYYHNVNERVYDKSEPASVSEGLDADNRTMVERLGRGAKVLVRPDGNNAYITAGRSNGNVVFMTTEGATDQGPALSNISLASNIDLNKQAQMRRNTEALANAQTLMQAIETAAAAGDYRWLHDFSHGPAEFQYILDLFAAINDRYGRDGEDVVWFATLDEIYEYNYFRNNSKVEKDISNNVLTLKFSCPATGLPNDMQFHRDFSVIVRGVDISENVEIESGSNVFGLSYAKQADGSLMVNVNCNKSLLDKAERYTAIYEEKASVAAKDDAMYFVNQLKASLRQTFVKRIQ